MNAMPEQTLHAFLPYVLSQKAVSLVIAASDASADEAVDQLESAGFNELKEINNLGRVGKRYLRISPKNAKESYDMALQYGTGQVSTFDQSKHQNSWVNPAYTDSAVVFVVTESELKDIEAKGLALRAAAGLATHV
jgi:L-aminopeptidase/D-esterase-like protein